MDSVPIVVFPSLNIEMVVVKRRERSYVVENVSAKMCYLVFYLSTIMVT